MTKALIIKREWGEGRFTTTTQYTGISQRDKLEKTMINLATCLGIDEIHSVLSSRLSDYYEPQGVGMIFQSASNTILELSEMLLKKQNTQACSK